jgi:hypothetical protein
MGRRAAVAVAVGMTLAVSACGPMSGRSADGPVDELSVLAADGADAAVEAGQCFAGSRVGDDVDALAADLARYGVGVFTTLSDDPTWTDPVDCAEPHQVEVYGVVELPPALDADLETYAAVVDPDPAVYAAVDDEVRRGCALSFAPAATAARSAPLAVDVTPTLSPGARVSLTWAPTSEASWERGVHTFACLFEQDRPGRLRLADVASGDFPAAARSCLRDNAFVPCGRPHDAERIAVIDLDRAVAQKQVAGERAVDDAGRVNLGSDVWSALDGVCQRYLEAAIPQHAPQLRGVADTYPELYPDADGRYVVLCSAQAPFGAAPTSAIVTTGSVFER